MRNRSQVKNYHGTSISSSGYGGTASYLEQKENLKAAYPMRYDGYENRRHFHESRGYSDSEYSHEDERKNDYYHPRGGRTSAGSFSVETISLGNESVNSNSVRDDDSISKSSEQWGSRYSIVSHVTEDSNESHESHESNDSNNSNDSRESDALQEGGPVYSVSTDGVDSVDGYSQHSEEELDSVGERSNEAEVPFLGTNESGSVTSEKQIDVEPEDGEDMLDVVAHYLVFPEDVKKDLILQGSEVSAASSQGGDVSLNSYSFDTEEMTRGRSGENEILRRSQGGKHYGANSVSSHSCTVDSSSQVRHNIAASRRGRVRFQEDEKVGMFTTEKYNEESSAVSEEPTTSTTTVDSRSSSGSSFNRNSIVNGVPESVSAPNIRGWKDRAGCRWSRLSEKALTNTDSIPETGGRLRRHQITPVTESMLLMRNNDNNMHQHTLDELPPPIQAKAAIVTPQDLGQDTKPANSSEAPFQNNNNTGGTSNSPLVSAGSLPLTKSMPPLWKGMLVEWGLSAGLLDGPCLAANESISLLTQASRDAGRQVLPRNQSSFKNGASLSWGSSTRARRGSLSDQRAHSLPIIGSEHFNDLNKDGGSVLLSDRMEPPTPP